MVFPLERILDEAREGRGVDPERLAADPQAFAGQAVGDDGEEVLGALAEARELDGM